MNREQLESKWTQLKGKARVKWGELTDDELEETKGRYDRLVSILQNKYASKKEEIKKDFDEWLDSLEE